MNLYNYVRQIILSDIKIIKIIALIIIGLVILPMIPLPVAIFDIIEDTLAVIMYFLVIIIFAPRENPSRKEFPVEIFGFTYSVIFMYYSAGVLVIDIFYANDFFKENMWIFGYGVTIISYVICIATLSRFMERSSAEIWGYIILNGTDVLTVTVVLGYLVQKFMGI